MILINHMPGNPYQHLTLRNFGFSDAAEAFFLMSGMAVALAYGGGIARWRDGLIGTRGAVAPIWRRARQLWLVQIGLTMTALALLALASWAYGLPELRGLHNGVHFHDAPWRSLAGMLALTYQVNYVNILPPYILLMLAAPLMLRAGIAAPRLTLVVSLAIWFAAGLLRLEMPVFPGSNGWQFNPLAWQAIFVTGMLIGLGLRDGRRLVPVRPWLLALAVAYLAFALAMARLPGLADPVNDALYRLESGGVPFHLVSHYKPYLALPRLLHALALAYLLSCLPAMHRLAASRAAAPVRLIGRHGLLVFSVGTMLALAGQILLRQHPDAAWLPWLLPPVATLLSLGVAWRAERRRAARLAALQAASIVTATSAGGA